MFACCCDSIWSKLVRSHLNRFDLLGIGSIWFESILWISIWSESVRSDLNRNDLIKIRSIWPESVQSELNCFDLIINIRCKAPAEASTFERGNIVRPTCWSDFLLGDVDGDIEVFVLVLVLRFLFIRPLTKPIEWRLSVTLCHDLTHLHETWRHDVYRHSWISLSSSWPGWLCCWVAN